MGDFAIIAVERAVEEFEASAGLAWLASLPRPIREVLTAIADRRTRERRRHGRDASAQD
jgi:hypothetical protein